MILFELHVRPIPSNVDPSLTQMQGGENFASPNLSKQ